MAVRHETTVDGMLYERWDGDSIWTPYKGAQDSSLDPREHAYICICGSRHFLIRRIADYTTEAECCACHARQGIHEG